MIRIWAVPVARKTARERLGELFEGFDLILVDQIMSRRRDPLLVDARMRLAVQLHEEGFSYCEIGRAMCRDHSTIFHLVNRRNQTHASNRNKSANPAVG